MKCRKNSSAQFYVKQLKHLLVAFFGKDTSLFWVIQHQSNFWKHKFFSSSSITYGGAWYHQLPLEQEPLHRGAPYHVMYKLQQQTGRKVTATWSMPLDYHHERTSQADK